MFQILGFDILLDDQCKAWLLGIHQNPNFNIMLEKEFMSNMLDETVSDIDLYVKKIIVGDAIKLSM